jgi:magnesium transporter
MPKTVRKEKPGQAPGTLVPPEQRVEKVSIEVIAYSESTYDQVQVETLEEADAIIAKSRVTWINVIGLHDVALLQNLAQRFDIHPLLLESVVNLGQRPSCQEEDDRVFVIMRLPHIGRVLDVEQVSLFFTEGVLISFQEIPDDDPFDLVRDRIRKGSGNLRKTGVDYLAYALIDCLVDSLYPVVETYGDAIELLEHQLLREPAPEMMERIQKIKRDLLWLRRTAWPNREVVQKLGRMETQLISDETRRYLRDSYDHAVQLMDVVETLRELTSSLTDLLFSAVSHKMNEVMKVLTIMASIFIPLTFIAGVYGMNFNTESPFNMPELNWSFGYPVAVLVMAVIAGGMVYLFRKKGWM